MMRIGRRKRQPASTLLLPHGVRALVPVFAVTGGAGRSTVAGLLAQVLAPTTRTVVIDPEPRAASPWTTWLGVESAPPGHAGLPGLLAGRTDAGEGCRDPAGPQRSHSERRRPDPAACLGAVVGRPVPLGRRERQGLLDIGPAGLNGPGYDVLTDTRAVTASPMRPPEDPEWYAAVVTAGDWFAGLVDLGSPIPAAHIAARHEGHASVLDRWWQRSDAVPVLVVPASGDGLTSLHRLVAILDQDGLEVARAVICVVDQAGSGLPRRLRSAVGALEKRALAVVEIPYDSAIRTRGLTRLDLVADTTLDAVRTMGRAIAGAVRPNGASQPTPSAAERGHDGGGRSPERDDHGDRDDDRARDDRPGDEGARSAGDGDSDHDEEGPPDGERTRRAPDSPTTSGGWVPTRHRVSSTPYDPDPDPASSQQPSQAVTGAAGDQDATRAHGDHETSGSP